MEWLLNQTNAMRHAIQDTRASISMRDGIPNLFAFTTRLGDLTRSTGFLFLEAHFKTLEYYSRIIHAGQEGSRELTIGTLAADLLSGYTLLNQREQWHYPVQPPDWNLMHRRGADRIP